MPYVKNTSSAISQSAVLCATVLALAVSFSALAFNISSDLNNSEVVVPVIAHNPGSHGTQWKTDLWITNTGSNSSSVVLTFFPQGRDVVVREMSITGFGALFLEDIVLETFGLDDVKGMLLISGDNTGFEVRGRIFNTGGGDGEFGQAFFGIPTARLSRQGFLSGVSTAEGNRVSVGIANPTDNTFEVTLSVFDSDSNSVYSEVVSLAPRRLIQFNNVADLWDLPVADALTVNIQQSSDNANIIYAYASVVRNDTGDATFIFGTAPNSGPP